MEDSEEIPKLLSINPEVTEMLDDPPKTLPSFVVENNGEWMCRKCKGRKIYEGHNHRVFYYDGKWRRRCASCAGKVRKRQRQEKRSRVRNRLARIRLAICCIAPSCAIRQSSFGHLKSSVPNQAAKEHVPIYKFGNDPHDRLVPLKSAPSQQLQPDQRAQVRHGVIHVPTRDIVASPDSYEIREHHKKHIRFYSPLQSVCYTAAKKTVGGVIYDVYPLIDIELAPLTAFKFLVRLSTVCDERTAESEITQRIGHCAQRGDSLTTTFMLRWDKDRVQLWHEDQPLLSTPINRGSVPLQSAGYCTTARTNIRDLQLLVIENQSFPEPVIHRTTGTQASFNRGVKHELSNRPVLIEGSELGSIEENSTCQEEDERAAHALKELHRPSKAFSAEAHLTRRVPHARCGSVPISVRSNSAARLICRPPPNCSRFISVWVPRRVTKDGFQHEVIPFIQFISSTVNIKMQQVKELLGPLKDWTVSNFVDWEAHRESWDAAGTPYAKCVESNNLSTNLWHVAKPNHADKTESSGAAFGTDVAIQSKTSSQFPAIPAGATGCCLKYHPAQFPKVCPHANQLVKQTKATTLNFRVLPQQ
eukprot:gb/GECG01007944.1/.p1 GENE.gb/GECG01007944.1/~~gb/GECG01007944.1/.p1  ORF type:complete len:588 (+),score=50.85 gb/GECG01007944.1/:1-1764(+)